MSPVCKRRRLCVRGRHGTHTPISPSASCTCGDAPFFACSSAKLKTQSGEIAQLQWERSRCCRYSPDLFQHCDKVSPCDMLLSISHARRSEDSAICTSRAVGVTSLQR